MTILTLVEQVIIMTENKIQLKSEFSWEKHKEYISVYSDNRLLQKNIFPNSLLSIDDIFDFLLFLRATRSKQEIVRYKFISHEAKEDVMTLLKKYHYIKESGDDSRLNRFVSSFPYTNFESFKNKLVDSNLLIIGLGTGGSYLTEYFIKLGINSITLIDGDRVERENISSQIYSESDIGKFKAKVLSDRYTTSRCHITAINMNVDSYSSLINLVDLSGINYIINCADDQNLNRDIIAHLFSDYGDAILISGGYSTLQQTLFKVTKENPKL